MDDLTVERLIVQGADSNGLTVLGLIQLWIPQMVIADSKETRSRFWAERDQLAG